MTIGKTLPKRSPNLYQFSLSLGLVLVSLLALTNSIAFAATKKVQCTEGKIEEFRLKRDANTIQLNKQIAQLNSVKTANIAQSNQVAALKLQYQSLKGICAMTNLPSDCDSAKKALADWKKMKAKMQKAKVAAKKKIKAIKEKIILFKSKIATFDKYGAACGVTRECSDGKDNDGDGLIDFGSDLDCLTTWNDSESSADDTKASHVIQWGITFQFDRPYHTGQFANGDFWVAPDSPGGNVVLVEILPAAEPLNGYPGGVIHGWQVNPSRTTDGLSQALDVRADNYKASLMPSLPYSLKGGDAVFKAISDTAYCTFPAYAQCLSTAAVLTVLDTVPPNEGADLFRPSYIKGQKKLISTASLHWNLLPTLQPPAGAEIPSIDTLAASIERVQNDWLSVREGRTRAKLHTPSSGVSISARNNEIVYRLFLNDSIEEKKQLMINMVQYGLDLYATYMDGQEWPAYAADGYGRMLPITFAGAMLQSSEMQSALIQSNENRFGEINSTYINPSDGIAYYGDSIPECHPPGLPYDYQYWDAMRTHSGARTCRNPYPNDPVDGGERIAWYYQTCCSSGYMQGTYVAFNLMPSLKQFYYDDAFMQYSQRWINHGPLASQDTCAPAIGTCDGGNNAGTITTSALGRLVCTGYKSNGQDAEFTADMSQYGIKFGDDGFGNCIKDLSPLDPMGRFDGYGRFPFEDGFNKADYGMTPFQRAMQQQYFSAQ